MMEGHTGSSIVQSLKEILTNYCVPPEKVVGMVTDNGSNMVLTADTLEDKYGCSAHTLLPSDVLHIPYSCALKMLWAAQQLS